MNFLSGLFADHGADLVALSVVLGAIGGFLAYLRRREIKAMDSATVGALEKQRDEQLEGFIPMLIRLQVLVDGQQADPLLDLPEVPGLGERLDGLKHGHEQVLEQLTTLNGGSTLRAAVKRTEDGLAEVKVQVQEIERGRSKMEQIQTQQAALHDDTREKITQVLRADEEHALWLNRYMVSVRSDAAKIENALGVKLDSVAVAEAHLESETPVAPI